MIIKSLDPRITRAGIDDESKDGTQQPLDHVHVGSLHAPDAELAILFAKEQYARRGQCVNLWVVKTADVFATEYEDEDIFATTPEKKYREPEVYKVMDRIQAFKAKQNS